MAGTLSGGQQRMLALARVLVDAPKVLVADELSLGLAPSIVEQTYAMLARIREAGTALLVIEQHVAHALALCDQVVVLDHGSVSWSGKASDAGERVQSYLEVGRRRRRPDRRQPRPESLAAALSRPSGAAARPTGCRRRR